MHDEPFCAVCTLPRSTCARRCPDHEFVSAAQHAHKLAEMSDPDRRAYLLDMARENVVSAKEARVPAPEPECVPNPQVERLRAAKESA